MRIGTGRTVAWFWHRNLSPLWGVAVGLLVMALYWPGVISVFPGAEEYAGLKTMRSVDHRIGDFLHPHFSTGNLSSDTPPIVVVGVTSQGVETYGPMPWPRTHHAQLIKRLDELGAKVIAFDIFFPKPAPGDAELAEACRTTGKVILPRWAIFPEMAPAARATAMNRHGELPVLSDRSRPVRFPDGVFRRRLRGAADTLYPHAFARGHINIFYDEDLVARRVPVAVGPPDSPDRYLPLGVIAALAARGEDPADAVIERDAIRTRKGRIPLDDTGSVIINYQPFDEWIDTRPQDIRAMEAKIEWLDASRKRAPIQFIPYVDVMEGRVPAGALKNAVVLVGQCVWGSREDVHITPFGSQFGVFVQAMLLYTTLTQQFMAPVSAGWTAAAVLLASTVLGAISFRLRYHGSTYAVFGGACLTAAFGVMAALVVVGLLRRNGLILDASPFILVVLLNLLGGVASSAARVGKEAERSNQAMEALLAAGERQMAEWVSDDQVVHSAVPGAERVALSNALVLRSPEIVAETFLQAVPCEGCILYVAGETDSRQFDQVISRGFESEDLLGQVRETGERWARESLRAGRIAVNSRHDREWPYTHVAPRLHSLLAVPVIVHGHPVAAVLLFNKRITAHSPERVFAEANQRLAGGLCYQAGALLENARRYKLEAAMFAGFAQSMAKAIDVRDPYTHGHSERVAVFSRGISDELGLSETERELVFQTATLHDVGKIGVDDAVLNKPGRLTDEEFALIQSHAAKGYEVLRGAPSFEPMLPGIRHHHERYDGRGYPDALVGERIPLLARIIAAADAYDAMTSDRVYRKALPVEQARQELLKGAGTQFDARVVGAFIRYLDKEARSIAEAAAGVDAELKEQAV